VLSRGTEWVFAQNIGHVVKFLGLNEKTGPELSPAQLVARLNKFLTAAVTMIPLMPASHLMTEAPGRPRPYKTLAYHIFQIPDVFLAVANGATLSYELLAVPPPVELLTFADTAAFGEQVRLRLNAWWAAKVDKSAKETVQTYYGPQMLHETLERTTWHSGQHCRQWIMLLGRAGVTIEPPLVDADFTGLPMPSSVWDG
jgi:hypothetical protein